MDAAPSIPVDLPSFAEALAEPPHGRVGANELVERVVSALFDPPSDDDEPEFEGDVWYGEGFGYP